MDKPEVSVSSLLLLTPAGRIRDEHEKRLNPDPLQGNEYCSGISARFAVWGSKVDETFEEKEGEKSSVVGWRRCCVKEMSQRKKSRGVWLLLCVEMSWEGANFGRKREWELQVRFNDANKREITHARHGLADSGAVCRLGTQFRQRYGEVKSSDRKGKGIPPALRAFARVLTVSTCEELTSLATEASESDGRLARRPLKNTSNEIQAHCILLSKFEDMIKCRDAVIKELESLNGTYCGTQLSVRRQMAIDLLRGEIRVLQSASAWIANYCKRISACFENHSINETSLFS